MSPIEMCTNKHVQYKHQETERLRIIIQGDKNGSIPILQLADLQLKKHHLLKRLSFCHCMVLAPLSKTK